MSRIEIRPAVPDDAPAIAALEAEAFPHPWRTEFFVSEIVAPGRFNRVAIDADGRLIGYVFAMHVLDEMHVNKIAVPRKSRRLGIASRLMDACFAFASKRQIRILSLEVRESNQEAIAFYQHLGFRRASIRLWYYPDGENAVIMSRELEPAEKA